MNKFRQTVKQRVIWSILSAVGAIAVYVIIYSVTGGMVQVDDFVKGFNSGVFSAVVGLSILSIISNCLTLRNEEKLKKLYIDENDERKLLIQQKSSSSTFNIVLYFLLLAAIVAGFFSKTVFFTLLASIFFMLLTRILTALYYERQLS
jgi:uncharacterized membrane protein